jgi:hypothetical protein
MAKSCTLDGARGCAMRWSSSTIQGAGVCACFCSPCGGPRGGCCDWLVMKTDGNGRKNLISSSVSIFFLMKTGSGSENAGSKTEPEYTDVRKRTNIVGNSAKTVRSRELKPEYRTSLLYKVCSICICTSRDENGSDTDGYH